jgi:hypothetical protein
MRLMQVINSETKLAVTGGRRAGKSTTQNLIFKGARGSNKKPVIAFDEMTEEKPAKTLKVKSISKAIRQALRGY